MPFFSTIQRDPTVHDLGNSGSSIEIDWSNGSRHKKLTLTEACQITMTPPAYPASLRLLLDGAYAVTWVGVDSWADGSAPSIELTTGDVVLSFWWTGTEMKHVGSIGEVA